MYYYYPSSVQCYIKIPIKRCYQIKFKNRSKVKSFIYNKMSALSLGSHLQYSILNVFEEFENFLLDFKYK